MSLCLKSIVSCGSTDSMEEDQLICCLRYIYIWRDSLERQVSDVGSEGSHASRFHVGEYFIFLTTLIASPKKLPLRRKHAEESMLDVSHL